MERRWYGAGIIIAIAIVVRMAAVLVLRSHEVPRSTFEHGEIAANLLAGRGFSVHFLGADGPTSQQAPLYPALVAGAYALGGVGTPRALLVLELGQAVLGGCLVAGVLRLAREIMPRHGRVALATGLIVAVHPTLVYAATHVQVALLAATLLTWSLALAYRAGRTQRAGDAAGAGLFIGLLLLTDPILGLVAPVACGIVGRLRSVAVMTVISCLVIAPWLYRNYCVHGEFVFIKSSFGYAFWQGNCALSEGTDKVVRPSVESALERGGTSLEALNRTLWKARHEAGYLDDIALTKQDYAELSVLSEPERSRWLFRRALADLADDPARYVRLSLRRLRYFFLFDETNPKTRNRLYRVGHVGLSVLALAGLLLAPADVRRRLMPTVWTVGLIALFHSLTIVSARFHVPIEPLLGLWGACAATRVSSGPAPTNQAGVAREIGRGAAPHARGERAPTATNPSGMGRYVTDRASP